MLYPNGEFFLGLSMPVKSHKVVPKPPEVRERKGQSFGSYARRMVRNGAWWLQRQFGKDSLSFLTCTLPDEVLEIFAISDNPAGLWSEILRQFEQWLRRCLERKGLCSFIVGVTEVQEKRWINHGKVGLHLHWVFQGRVDKKLPWSIKKEEFARAWCRVISNVLDREIRSTTATRIERVKKSVENYLSKYMSKGGRVIDEIIESGKRELLPSSWWNVSHALRRLIKSMMKSFSDDAKNCLYDTKNELKEQGIIQWFYVHEIDYLEPCGEVLKIPVAFVGKLSKPEFIDMFT